MKKISLILGMCMLLTGCSLFHTHEFEEPTCVAAKTCKECGETEGEPLGHEFEEATCIVAKTCKVCGTTEGEALGHTTDLGNCETCSEFVNVDVMYELAELTMKKDEYNKKAYDCIINSNLSFYGCNEAATEYLRAKYTYDDIIELCGDYELLKEVKEKATAARDSIPTEIRGNSLDDIKTFINKVQDFLLLEREVTLKCLEVIEEWETSDNK